MESDNFDKNLRAYFSHRYDVPPEVRVAVQQKLYATSTTKQSIGFIWLIAISFILATAMLIFIGWSFFGQIALTTIWGLYYFMSMMCASAIIVISQNQNYRRNIL